MQKHNKNFKNLILLHCYDALEQVGFVRFRKQDVDKPVTQDFHCWVGLNTGLYQDRLEISPFVGVHVIPIAKICAFGGRIYNRGIATYAIPMGDLSDARNERTFVFTPAQGDAFVTSEALRLARIYATVGLNYAESISTYETLLPLLESRLGMLGGYPERVACCLFLMGEIRRARIFVEGFVKMESNYFADFAAYFLGMVEREQTK